jgi:hypothetical protein
VKIVDTYVKAIGMRVCDLSSGVVWSLTKLMVHEWLEISVAGSRFFLFFFFKYVCSEWMIKSRLFWCQMMKLGLR